MSRRKKKTESTQYGSRLGGIVSFFGGREREIPPKKMPGINACSRSVQTQTSHGSGWASTADFPINFITQFYYQNSYRVIVLHFTRNIAYHILEMLIFYAAKVLAMGHSRNHNVFIGNLATLLKSRKLDAREIFHVFQ